MKWIKVEDRLPDAGISVLIFVKGRIDIGERKKNSHLFYGSYFSIEEISHWQPLPKRPKD